MKEIPIPDNVKELMQALIDRGFEAYIIGGAVRDKILGIEPKDWDVFTNATGEQILDIFPQGHVIGGEERQAKILTVVVDGVEISQYRANGDRTETGVSLRNHINTCDFTINAVAIDIDGKYYDYVDGVKDIKNKVLRFVGDADQRLREDPLRVFRGVRFFIKYNLHILDTTPFATFQNYVSLLPKERVRDEFMKIIVMPYGLLHLNLYRMLGWIVPEWTKCEHLEGGEHHDEAVGVHMLSAVLTAQDLTNNSLLMLAIFLHDIGKAESVGSTENGITFYNHQTIGAEIAAKWMRDMKFSNEEIAYVTTVIKHHMMGDTAEISDNTFSKICNDLKNAGIAPEDMLVMTYSDNQANSLKPRLTFNEFIKANGFLQRWYSLFYKQGGFNPNCLEVNGHDIMNLGWTGKEIGEIKTRLFEDVTNGLIMNRRDRLLERLINYKESG